MEAGDLEKVVVYDFARTMVRKRLPRLLAEDNLAYFGFAIGSTNSSDR